ncbi:hypothetical protein H2248_012037 [Termitomyces sp. 'cryptogamus']|nr:hypothetical protein H2248_012037 [Termitomyces sp. 'cryptogamus']
MNDLTLTVTVTNPECAALSLASMSISMSMSILGVAYMAREVYHTHVGGGVLDMEGWTAPSRRMGYGV